MKLHYLAFFINLVIAEQFSLITRDIDTDINISIGTFDYDFKNSTTTLVELNAHDLDTNGPVCLDTYSLNDQLVYKCFQFIELSTPLHYNLVLDVYHNCVKKISLSYNPRVDGITPEVRDATRGPNPETLKLKKVTKTYKDTKVGDKELTAQFVEDVDREKQSWIQKNWKKLVVIAIIYSVVSSFTNGAQQNQTQNKHD